MKNFFRLMSIVLLPLNSCSQNREQTPVTRPDSPITLSIHYADGLEASSLDEEQTVIFQSGGRNTLYLLFTNSSNQVLTLWKPYCPEGDRGIAFEFKLEKKSKEVAIAKPIHGYTAGMGFPKTLRLESGKSLIFPIDFSEFWSVPFVLEPGQVGTLYFRLVYESRRGTSEKTFIPKDANVVWEGKVESDWQMLKLVNFGKKMVPIRPTHKVNLLSREGNRAMR